jgi:hypothetical protein
MAPEKGVSAPTCLHLKMQEIPYDHPDSRWMFTKNFVATRAAYHVFGPEVLFACLLRLQELAVKHTGLDYLQVFENLCKLEYDGKNLWFIEDGAALTALLPEDY